MKRRFIEVKHLKYNVHIYILHLTVAISIWFVLIFEVEKVILSVF